MSPAFASYACDGTVSSVCVGKDGFLYVNNGYRVHKPCSVTNNDTCKSWLSMVMVAQEQNRSFSIYHSSSETPSIK